MSQLCRWCGAELPSRNKLFSHVRENLVCAAAAAADDERAPDVLAEGSKPTIAAFLVGYSSDAVKAEHCFKEALASVGARKISVQRTSAEPLGHTSRQESSCAALGDVFVASFASVSYSDELLHRMQAAINIDAPEHTLRVLDAQKIASMNVESFCTHRSFIYLLPISVLMKSGGDDDSVVKPDLPPEDRRAQDPRGSAGTHPAFKDLKKALKKAIQVRQDGHSSDHPKWPRAPKRSWHNFADPAFASLLDPHGNAVQSILDKFCCKGTIVIEGAEFMILNIVGDRFLPQQCRRLIATALCVHHGWLPDDIFVTATRPDVVLPTPLAPELSLYLEEARFSFWEQKHGRLFSADQSSQGPVAAWREDLHRRIAATSLAKAAKDAQSCFTDWMRVLEAEVAPRIRDSLRRVATVDAITRGDPEAQATLVSQPMPASDDCPSEYFKCLELLRQADRSGSWPESSQARAKIIQGSAGGSFSVGQQAKGQNRPRGNDIFPELTEAVFELEKAIAPNRTPSTMVAINRNAKFSPHTDSGAGLGQSTSLIVGLGAYVGGELAVEGDIHPVWYKPLEFDGWKQRHWTLPFLGERYSLVWFTPA